VSPVYLGLTPELTAFRAEVRAYLTALMTPGTTAALRSGGYEGPLYREIVRTLGRDGWLGLSWPKEYGGQGKSLVHQAVFFDESQRLGVPVPFLTTNTVGPTLMAFGSDEQKERFLPGIVRGEIHFSIGYSEPDAGTDLASLRTRAVRDGDDYVVNGQKQWTSIVHHADYIWLACRTDPDAPKHKGISILIVPTSSPGFSWTPVPVIGGGFTSATFYDDVRVPAANLVAGENKGWKLITSQLNHERVALSSPGMIERRLDDVRAWAQQTKLPDGRRVIEAEWVQANLARVRAKLEFLRLLNGKVVAGAARGSVAPADASAVKVFGSEFYIEAYRLLMEVLGPAAALRDGSPGAVLAGDLERAMRSTLILTFGGGTNEIQRDIIATIGLGMPRAPR
jgi:3-oxocholest-4-en-26-oyl-CoA dehydrogenase alpha subunit